MSPCPPSGVKPRARSQPRRYPTASAAQVSRIRTGELWGRAAAAMQEIAAAVSAL